MPKMFLVLMILLLTNNICNAAIYKNIENDFLIDIGDNWNLSDKSTQEGGLVLIFTASDDKKSTVRVGVSPVIDEKENATLRNMPKELLNGKNIALVSDAGTPGISDPGEELIKEAIKKERNLHL